MSLANMTNSIVYQLFLVGKLFETLERRKRFAFSLCHSGKGKAVFEQKYIGCLISEDLTQKLSKGLFPAINNTLLWTIVDDLTVPSYTVPHWLPPMIL